MSTTTDITRADICAVAIAEAFRGDGERLCNPIGNLPLIGGRLAAATFEPHLALTDGMQSWIHAHGISSLGEARELIDVNLSGWDGGTILGGSIDFYRDAVYRQAPSESDLLQRLFDAFCQRFTWPGLSKPRPPPLTSARLRNASKWRPASKFSVARKSLTS